MTIWSRAAGRCEPGQVRKEAAISSPPRAPRSNRVRAGSRGASPGTRFEGGCTVARTPWPPPRRRPGEGGSPLTAHDSGPGRPRGLPAAIGRLERLHDYSRARARRHAAAILVAVLLAILAFQLFPSRTVTLLTGGRAVQVRAVLDGERAALEAASLALAPGDRLFAGRVGDHATLALRRATSALIVADGAAVEVRTQARTVAGALAAAGVAAREGDRVYVDGFLAAPGARLVRDATTDGPVRIEVTRARPVTIYVDGRPIETRSIHDTVGEVIADAGIGVREGDLVSHPLDGPVPPDAVIRLRKARSIVIVVDGVAENVYTQVTRVGEVLDLFGVDTDAGASVSHALDALVTDGMEIVVSLTREVIEETLELTPPPVIRRDDHTLAPGEERVVEGEPGRRLVRERVTYRGGVEIARELLDSEVVRVAVATEHLVGPSAGDGDARLVTDDYTGRYRSKLRVWATWYDATHGGKERDDPNWGITATGIPLEHGICAVDPDVIPLLTRFYVPGYGPCLAADVGGGIRGNHIDLGFPEDHAPNPWYTGYVDIYILD